MDTNKILTSDLLDLVFDDRNKEYGAYELRKHYQQRITRALLVTGTAVALIITGTVMANSVDRSAIAKVDTREYTLEALPDVKQPEPLLPVKPPEQAPPPRTEIFTPPVLADQVPNPPPSQNEYEDARIDDFHADGPDDSQISDPVVPMAHTGIIEEKNDRETGPLEFVQIDAKCACNWVKFLERNLQSTVPVDNGAPVGRYKVIVQFVVDIDGTVSDIKPLTSLGYGMEEEAVRVLKKAVKWEPAIQNGRQVKAYRRQVIIFEVEEG